MGLALVLVEPPHAALAFFGFGDKYERVAPENGVVRIDVSDVDDGRVHYFSYASQGKDVRFFVVRSHDGVIRAAFDACDVCWREGKGYAGDGEAVVCNNCGQRFAAQKINEVKGGCNPAPLRRVVDGGTVLIAAADIMEGARYF
ncbi:MAG: DUF2318 domain-containing protein [Desulfovibrionaceae bacterium]|nr:DUF2318 domain-containing protein [Desulfovibrionaceae bacterium]